MALEYIVPEIFDKEKIISGVTQKNMSLFPKFGLSVSKADILTDDDLFLHQRVFAKLLGVGNDEMKYQMQIHSDIIREVTKESELLDGDGLFTSEKGIVLNVKIADCAAVLIYDPSNEVVMALHSGWRGTSQNISGKGISILKQKYNSNPEDLKVFISPAAGGDSYEIGEDVAIFFPNSVRRISDSKYLFDNKNEISIQLINAGVKQENIEISQICTIKDTLYHSFRRDKKISGRMSAFIGMLKNPE